MPGEKGFELGAKLGMGADKVISVEFPPSLECIYKFENELAELLAALCVLYCVAIHASLP
jgi:hypothetical protein